MNIQNTIRQIKSTSFPSPSISRQEEMQVILLPFEFTVQFHFYFLRRFPSVWISLLTGAQLWSRSSIDLLQRQLVAGFNLDRSNSSRQEMHQSKENWVTQQLPSDYHAASLNYSSQPLHLQSFSERAISFITDSATKKGEKKSLVSHQISMGRSVKLSAI